MVDKARANHLCCCTKQHCFFGVTLGNRFFGTHKHDTTGCCPIDVVTSEVHFCCRIYIICSQRKKLLEHGIGIALAIKLHWETLVRLARLAQGGTCSQFADRTASIPPNFPAESATIVHVGCHESHLRWGLLFAHSEVCIRSTVL